MTNLMKTECVYCAVRAEPLTVIQFIFIPQVATADVKSTLYFTMFCVRFYLWYGHLVADFVVSRLRICWKINLD